MQVISNAKCLHQMQRQITIDALPLQDYFYNLCFTEVVLFLRWKSCSSFFNYKSQFSHIPSLIKFSQFWWRGRIKKITMLAFVKKKPMITGFPGSWYCKISSCTKEYKVIRFIVFIRDSMKPCNLLNVKPKC